MLLVMLLTLKIIDNLDNGRPVLLGGNDNSSGHLWVCDGYNWPTVTTNGITAGVRRYNMNWGWYGLYNGLFLSYDWHVISTSGTTVYDFRSNHHGIVDIRP